jgi:DNA-binding NtrC family response regulator
LPLRLRIAHNCGEAALALWSAEPPHLVFTDVQLPDGAWTDILTLAGKALQPVNVIVVAPLVDVSFYIQAIERGAFDYIVPPMSEPELLHVVRIAAENALARRREAARARPVPSAITAESRDRHGELAMAGAEE